MGLSQVGLPTRTKVDPAVRRPLDLTARLQEYAPGRPRVVRMPSDWWDSPAVAACPLGDGAQSGRTARKFTRNTLKEWDLVTLADDAEAIVGEFVANAVSHAARSEEHTSELQSQSNLVCRLLLEKKKQSHLLDPHY